jgi:hypothetical protein
MRVWPQLSVAALRSGKAARRASIDILADLAGAASQCGRHVRRVATGTQRTFAAWSWLLLPIAVVCLLVVPRSGGMAGPAGSNDYVLGSQDKVRLKVFEWRASRDEIFEWTAFNAEYNVVQGGNISQPLVGDVQAAGKSPTDL